uniref:Multiple inositol polyphosphate phosphatase 1 n=1 Tax=Cucumis sativus TaxID=3659 RepID=A0A0A0KM06_CUCSA
MQKYKKKQKPKVEKLKEPVLHDITKSLTERYDLNFTQQHISSLWFLCKQEASLLNKTDQACGLFNPSEVALLEWTDDIEVFMLKGYGNSLNYRMGVNLLKDVFESMKNAIKARQVPGRLYEKARLRFSHAETVIPFTCLLGLFLEGEAEAEEFKQIQTEHYPLELPPRPPATRNWKVSNVSPFAGNNMLVLYSCPVANSFDEYFVRVLHNEEPIAMPGCDGSYFCPFNMFKEKIVDPLLKHDFKKLCTVNEEEPTQVLESSKLSLFDWPNRYGASKGDRPASVSAPPNGCIPIYLNLVARHGTRAPTTKRIKELNNLENELKKLLGANVGNDDHLFSLPSWLKDWKSPWAAKINGGELIPEGEKELYDLGIQTKKLFSDLFIDPYNSDIYTIKATQVARASASAVAFGMGLFSGNGNLGSDRHRAFSVVTESRANDTMLRFFDRCHKYEDYKKDQKPKVEELKEPVLVDITKSVTARYGLKFTPKHISTLWFLCKQEASLFDTTDQACGLFTPSEVLFELLFLDNI